MRQWKDDRVKKHIQTPKISFMLDSGAFTFMNSGGKVDWKQYVNEYIDFINKWDIKYFIELDLYGILGVEKNRKNKKKNRTENR